MNPLTLLKFWREIAIGVLLAAVAGQQVRVSNEKAAHAKTRSANAVVLRDLAQKTLATYQAVQAEDERRKAANSALDAKHTQELTNAKSEIERLRGAVRDGSSRLRVNASCTPVAPSGVPQTTSAGRVDDATGPRLADAAEQDYFSLRDGIETARSQITGLQAYIRDVCLSATDRTRR